VAILRISLKVKKSCFFYLCLEFLSFVDLEGEVLTININTPVTRIFLRFSIFDRTNLGKSNPRRKQRGILEES
jgi:hypothetical protein